MHTFDLVAYRNQWCARFNAGGKRRRLSTGFAATDEHRDAAQRKAREIVNAFVAPVEDRVGPIVEAYLEDRADRVVDIYRLRDAWKRLSPFFAGFKPEQVSRATCRQYVEHRRRDVADGTINKELRTLRAALRWHDPQTPAVVECLPEPEPRDRWLTRDEFKRLLDEAGSEHLFLFLHLAIGTAGRKEALLQLTWMQVRFDKNEIWLGQKANGKKRATVPMSDTLRGILEEARGRATSEYVVEYEGRPIKNIRHAFERATRAAGLEDVHIHDLRHTAAVWMCERGIPIEQISAFLGHSDISVTQRVYARHQPGHLTDAAAALDL